MRRNIVSCLALAALFSSCAYEGVVVEKRFRPVPFSDSLGVDAMYNFHLRDNAGQVHSQMVTADIFASYATGDYFNDLQPPPEHGDKELEGFRPAPREMNEGPYQPVRVMQIRPPQKAATRVVVRSNRSIKGVANAAIHSNHSVKGVARIAVHPAHSSRSAKNVAVHSNRSTKSAPKVTIHSNHPVKSAKNVAIHSNDSARNAARIAVKPDQYTRSAATISKSHRLSNHTPRIVHHKKKATKVASKHRKHHPKTVASVS